MIKSARKKLIRGFTLIELLIVIAILGILAAAVLIAINPTKRQNQAKDSNIKSDIGSIATAIQAYYTSAGTPTNGSGSYPKDLATLQSNNDLKSIPIPPAPATAYTYVAVPAGCDPEDTTPPLAGPCDEVSVYTQMHEDTSKQWCWKSKTGKATAVADCSDPNVAN